MAAKSYRDGARLSFPTLLCPGAAKRRGLEALGGLAVDHFRVFHRDGALLFISDRFCRFGVVAHR